MAKTFKQTMDEAQLVADHYTYLQQQMFYQIVNNVKNVKPYFSNIDSSDPNAVLEWRLKALSQMHALTDEVVDMMSQHRPALKRQIYRLIEKDGIATNKQLGHQLSRELHKPMQKVSQATVAVLRSYAETAWKNCDNYVNQSLISTNYGRNPVAKTYQEIINKSTMDVITGNRTLPDALFFNIQKWQDKGLVSDMVDRGGHHWSMEAYTRTVITTSTQKAFNEARMDSMSEWGVAQGIMSAHAAARPDCAPIQGHIVNLVPKDDPNYDDSYPTIYDYEYGEPQGCFGINCMHTIFPYVEGVTINHEDPPDPDEAIENEEIQQKQRYYERQVRHNKYKLRTAKKLGDDKGAMRYQSSIRGYQKRLRKIVKDHDFLTRQYDREKIAK